MTVKWEIVPQTMAACLSRFYRIVARHSGTAGHITADQQFYRRELVALMLYKRRPRYPMKAKRINWLNTLVGFT